MRRLIILALVAFLGIAPLVVLPVAAQGGPPDFGTLSETGSIEGVARPWAQLGKGTNFDGSVLQPFEVYFGERYARIASYEFAPEHQELTEFMVVEVKQGRFALAPDSGSFIVDPAGETPIQYVRLPTKEPEPTLEPAEYTSDYVRDADENICTNMCAIPSGLNSEDRAVQLKPGDIVIAHAQSLCLWCLLRGSQSDPEDPSAIETAPVPDSGLLLVHVQLAAQEAPDSFSWIQAWDSGNSLSATPTANLEPVAMAWAFNPPTGCK